MLLPWGWEALQDLGGEGDQEGDQENGSDLGQGLQGAGSKP